VRPPLDRVGDPLFLEEPTNSVRILLLRLEPVVVDGVGRVGDLKQELLTFAAFAAAILLCSSAV
jgi:hypothetical protein